MSVVAPDYDSAARPPRAIEELRDTVQNIALLRALVSRNIKVRYKRSVFGILWSAANPLLMLLVLTLAFSATFQPMTRSYPAFLFPGLLLWNLFAQMTSVTAAEMSMSSALWMRVRIPKTATPLANALTNLANLFIVMVPLVIVMAALRWPIGPAVIAIVPVAILTAVFAFGFSLLLSSVVLYFPDAAHVYQIVLSAWFFLTPVIYPPDATPRIMKRLLVINPMARYVEAFRRPLYLNSFPSAGEFLWLVLIAFATLAAGWLVYTRCADDIPYQS